MPKAPSSSGSNRPALRRNQACRTCRKRKLKCDASRPHCGTCVKQWEAAISVPAPVGYAHPPEPQCHYDPVEGLALAPEVDPIEKIRVLEQQISHLKNRLDDSHNTSSRSVSPSYPHMGNGHHHMSMSSDGGRLSPDRRMGGRERGSDPLSVSDRPSNSPALPREGSSEGFMNLLFTGWNSELPDPSLLDHFIDIFFKCDPCSRHVLHRPSFLAAMKLGPRSPEFPHSAILHAICASASRWSSQDVTTLPDGSRRDQFAEYHASMTRQYIDKTMATGEDIFAVMQATVLLSWYFYQEGRWVEVWIFAGFQTRVAIPLRLNYPGTFTTSGSNSPGAYMAPPKDARDLESRRRTWWMTIIFDRVASIGGWMHAIDERDLGTEFPLRSADFESDQYIPNNPQDLLTKDVFLRHPPQYTDSFILFLKSIILFGRVTDFNVRSGLRTSPAALKAQDPFCNNDFVDLDQLIYRDFLEHLPPVYKASHGLYYHPDGSLDTDLYLVHIIPHAATITLHNPYIDFGDSDSISTDRCVNSARAILSAYYMLSSTPLDITRLHPFVTIVWYLAAVVQVQLCKYFIDIEDADREVTVWTEINALRHALIEYGGRSPIGIRQEKLLQGIMRDIVRLTTQKQPLEVGVPMYPFSHAGAFDKIPSSAGGPLITENGHGIAGQSHMSQIRHNEDPTLDDPSTMSRHPSPLTPSNGVGMSYVPQSHTLSTVATWTTGRDDIDDGSSSVRSFHS